MREWERFKVRRLGTERFNQSCQLFKRVSHTSHIDAALKIIECGEIRPGLVFDESKLNKQRILVSWVSPNHWGVGFRYGNVRFEFNFAELVRNKRFYWVESVAYKIEACRILITDTDRDKELRPYDPTAGDGPWWYDQDSDSHYFNNHHCLEFMIEGALPVSSTCNFDFVDHHKEYCNQHRLAPRNCSELGKSVVDGAALFFSRAAVTNIDLDRVSPFFLNNNGNLRSEVQFAVEKFASAAALKVDFHGTISASSIQAAPLVRGESPRVS